MLSTKRYLHFHMRICIMEKISITDLDFDPVHPAKQTKLNVATASNLLSEFAHCPNCSKDIEADVANGRFSDRDVVWDRDVSGSDYYYCPKCNAKLQLLVEEKAKPTLHNEIPDERWAEAHLWVETSKGNFVGINTNAIYVTKL